MYCYSAYLRVEGNALYGRKHFWSKWVRILPSDIEMVKKYTIPGPYIKIFTTKGSFFVGAFTEHYASVKSFLQTHTDLKGF